jgi:hypothetical protein
MPAAVVCLFVDRWWLSVLILIKLWQAMVAANSAVPVQQMQQTMMQFEKQSEMASMKEEMMDDILNADDDEEEGN